MKITRIFLNTNGGHTYHMTQVCHYQVLTKSTPRQHSRDNCISIFTAAIFTVLCLKIAHHIFIVFSLFIPLLLDTLSGVHNFSIKEMRIETEKNWYVLIMNPTWYTILFLFCSVQIRIFIFMIILFLIIVTDCNYIVLFIKQTYNTCTCPK